MLAAANSTKLFTRGSFYRPAGNTAYSGAAEGGCQSANTLRSLAGQQADAEAGHRRTVQHGGIVDRQLGSDPDFGARRGLGHLELVLRALAGRRQQRVVAQAFGALRRRVLL